MLRNVRVITRCFNTVKPYYEEHYQYPGNPTNEEFNQFLREGRKTYVQDTTIFKPKEQIEFNRIGELLLYEAEVYRLKDIYAPYPAGLLMLALPFNLYMYLVNPFSWLWQSNNYFAWLSIASFYPYVEYYYSLRYFIHKIHLLRGGRVLKIEHSNVVGNRFKTWIFIDEINLLSKDKLTLLPEKGAEAKVIDEDGNLIDETYIQVENFVDVGRNYKDSILTLCKEGRVYHPEIFSAVIRGFEVDTSNFRINTLHTERWLEPNSNL
jgi:hypothetical protein